MRIGLAAEVEGLGGRSAVVVGVQGVEDDAPTVLLSHPCMSAAGPTHVRPTELTLQMFDGWPASASEEALHRLVAALTAEIDQTTDEQKRSKLLQVRAGITGVARDLFLTALRAEVQDVVSRITGIPQV